MADSLKQIRLLPEYYGDQAFLSKDFWVPVVNASSQVKIIIRSFSQNTLVRILNTIRAQKDKNFNIRLILNPLVSSSQLEALNGKKSSKELANSISDVLYNDISNMDKKTLSEYAELFNYYFGEKALAIKIALAMSKEDQSIIANKTPSQNIVLFTDSFDDSISFSEAKLSGDISIDREAFNVAWSWGDPKYLVNKRTKEFDRIWGNKHDGLKVIEVEADIILQVINKVINEQDKSKFELFNHQKKAIEKWAENSFRGIFKMCTGAGKTIAALAGLKRLEKYLLDSGKTLNTAVIICHCCPVNFFEKQVNYMNLN